MTDDIAEATGITVTATPHFEGKFLIVRRSLADPYLPGVWAYPGGRVHYETKEVARADGSRKLKAFAETLTLAAAREVFEETGLRTTGAFYVDSYQSLGERAAAHFCVDVLDDHVVVNDEEIMDFRWIHSLFEQEALTPRIDGLDNHLVRIQKELTFQYSGPFRSYEELDLTPDRYLNVGAARTHSGGA